MSARFLRTSDLSTVRAITLHGTAPLLSGVLAIDRVTARVPQLLNLFAEPVITRDDEGNPKSAKWYTQYDHEARRLSGLAGDKRLRAEENLKTKLAIAADHLNDPEIGELLAVMLNIRSLDSIYFLGTQPVLTDWGMAQTDEAEALPLERLSVLFPAVMGAAGAGALTVIPTVAVDAPVVENSMGAIEDASFTETDAAAGYTSVDVAETIAFQPDVIYVDRTPFYHRRWFRIILYGVLALLIIWLLWWLLLARPGGLLVRPADMTGTHGLVLEGLRRERDRLKGLLDDPCSPEAATSLRAGLTGPVTPVAPETAVPPSGATDTAPGIGGNGTTGGASNAPDAAAEAPSPSAGTPPSPAESSASDGHRMPLSTLAYRMERSVALIIGALPSGGISMGSGFFISPDTIVTNRHVIAEADPNRIAITSKAIGHIRKARVVAKTGSSKIGHSDYAVLKLDQPVNVSPVPLSVATTKLMRVVAVGYPAYLTEMDPKLMALIKGDQTAAPEMVFTSGEISVIQHQGPSSPPIIIHTADMSQGNSGGPLVDQCGRVIGINTFIGKDDASGRRGLFSLGAADLMRFLDGKGIAYVKAKGSCPPGEPSAAASGTGN